MSFELKSTGRSDTRFLPGSVRLPVQGGVVYTRIYVWQKRCLSN